MYKFKQILFLLSGTLLMPIALLHAQESPRLINSDSLIEEGIKLHDEGKFEEAIALYNQVDRNDSGYYNAMIEKSLTLIHGRHYQEAYETCLEAQKVRNRLSPNLYINMGTALDNLERSSDAVKAYDEGLRYFPKNYMLWFNRGVSLENIKKWQEAFDSYLKVLEIYPFHPGTHIRLGVLCAREGHLTQAMLSLNMFFLLEPKSERSLSVLEYLNSIVIENDQVAPVGIRFPEGDHFEELDLILKNHVAFRPKYKLKSKLDYKVVRQNQVLLEKIEYNPSDKGIWMQFYAPVFAEIAKKGYTEAFSYFFMLSSTNKDVVEVLDKKIKPINEFSVWLKQNLSGFYAKRNIVINGKEQLCEFEYLNSMLDAIGNRNAAGQNVGYWEFYNQSGSLYSKGGFNNNGNREGKWVWYYDNGRTWVECEYLNGNIEGVNKSFTYQGFPKRTDNYAYDLLDGKSYEYYPSGEPMEISTYSNGKLNGEFTNYYPNRQIHYKATYAVNNLNDKLLQYTPTGHLISDIDFSSGQKNGRSFEYFTNGKLKTREDYYEGKANGELREYYPDGSTRSEGTATNHAISGIYKSYYENGKLKDECLYDSIGNLSGTKKTYSPSGFLLATTTYDGGVIKAYRFFDSQNNVLSEAEEKDGHLFYKAYNADGELAAEGEYFHGRMEGPWKIYNNYGTLQSEEEYNEGLLNGIQREYFRNGKLKQITHYSQGVMNGLHQNFYVNGKLCQQGIYKNGELAGYWFSYNIAGTLTSKNYYVDNLLNGWQDYYSNNGKLFCEEYDENNLVYESIFFDSLGNISDRFIPDSLCGLQQVHFNDGKLCKEGTYHNGVPEGTFRWINHNGNNLSEFYYVNGQLNGQYNRYTDNGKLWSCGYYVLGDKDSTWLVYDEDGNIRSREQYLLGNKNGEGTTFFANGKTASNGSFRLGLEDGAFNYYSPQGDLAYTLYYELGKLKGYSYLLATGKTSDTLQIENETAHIISYFANGKKSAEFDVNKGWIEGNLLRFHSNGNVWKKTSFKNNMPEGSSKTFYANGKIENEELMYGGELNGTCQYFYPNGNLKKSINFILGRRYGEAKYYVISGLPEQTKIYYDDVLFSESK
jgi:uncharacterized protein